MGRTRGATQQFLAGRYRFVDLMGDDDDAGEAWWAEDIELGRSVAVRELGFHGEPGETMKRRLVARMLREAEVMAMVCPECVVDVLDIIEEDGRLWAVTELIDARPLDRILKEEGPLEAGPAARMGLELLDVLGAAHREGITHGDVRPSHILVRADGRVVLTGFGVTIADGILSFASARMPDGAAAYASPERAGGARPGPASDLWSLGAVLYAMVEGSPPYVDQGSPEATLDAVAHEPLRAPDRAGPLIPAINGLLRKNPVERTDEPVARRALVRVVSDALLENARGRAPGPAPGAPLPTGALDPAADGPTSGRASQVAALRELLNQSWPGPVAPRGAAVASPGSDVAEPTGEPTGEPWRRRVKVLALGAAAILVVLGTGVAVFTPISQVTGTEADRAVGGAAPTASGGTSVPSTPTPSVSAPQPPATPSQTTSEETAPASPEPAGEGEDDALPAGFSLHTDPQGFSIALPGGWTRIGNNGFSSGSRFGADGDPRRLLVDVTDDPGSDPVAAWKKQESEVSDTILGYDRIIRIRAKDYRGWKAADWEWTFIFEGVRYRTLNRGFVVDSGHGYAIKWSVPESEWYTPENQQALKVFLESFQPSG